ncbi:MAG TPA: hypothetical protein PK718_08245 [Candidatus Methanofastidiosa archaeon]|nr:hypothetical protein [Candidatus Methanofastidiosa archaeon]HPR42514.1 hypothetical protein [Candidatus Methanofastidiosa archaeon]
MEDALDLGQAERKASRSQYEDGIMQLHDFLNKYDKIEELPS